MSLSTPIVFIIFNRPDLTEVVFGAIAKAKPQKLLIVADGPRFPEEAENCQKTRSVIKRVDWDCEVSKNFSEENLGCGRRVASGLDWAFSIVEEAIILEDDCLPDPTFFPFCEELLEEYRHNQRIMMISGNNFLNGTEYIKYSYYFSRYNHIWGWATWRRAWHFFDANMTLWKEIRDDRWIDEIYETDAETDFRRKHFEGAYTGAIDTWDYAWSFSCLIQNGLTINPSVNLVSNIGFGPEATHTKTPNNIANFPRSTMTFPLRHPPYILRDSRLDRREVELILGIPSKVGLLPTLMKKFAKRTRSIARAFFRLIFSPYVIN